MKKMKKMKKNLFKGVSLVNVVDPPGMEPPVCRMEPPVCRSAQHWHVLELAPPWKRRLGDLLEISSIHEDVFFPIVQSNWLNIERKLNAIDWALNTPPQQKGELFATTARLFAKPGSKGILHAATVKSLIDGWYRGRALRRMDLSPEAFQRSWARSLVGARLCSYQVDQSLLRKTGHHIDWGQDPKCLVTHSRWLYVDVQALDTERALLCAHFNLCRLNNKRKVSQ